MLIISESTVLLERTALFYKTVKSPRKEAGESGSSEIRMGRPDLHLVAHSGALGPGAGPFPDTCKKKKNGGKIDSGLGQLWYPTLRVW